MSHLKQTGSAEALLWGLCLAEPEQTINLEASDFKLPSSPCWFHLHSDHPDCKPLLAQLGLDKNMADIMTAIETRPRVVPHEDGILIVLRGVNTNPGADPEDMVSLRIWLQDNLLVTARKSSRQLMAARETRDQVLAGHGPDTTEGLIVQLIQGISNRISVIVEGYDEALDRLEHRIQAGDTRTVALPLADTRRQIAEIRRYVAPQREALSALLGLRLEQLSEVDFELREQADRATRLVEELDLAREKALLLQEELRNRIAEQQNQRMYVLSLVTAIFLPLSFLTGVFGMNVAGLPGVENPNGFLILACSMLVIGCGVLVWMKVKRWF